MAGGLVTHTAISNWFVRRRGRAIAIANMGSHLGNTMMAPLTVLLLASAWGWQGVFLVFGILAWLAIPLPAVLFMRRRPEDMGLYPDGRAPQESRNADPVVEGDSIQQSSRTVQPEPVWTRREVLGTTSFWFLLLSSSAAGLSLSGINISLAPYIQDLGFGGAMLAVVMASRTTIQLLATPLWGLAAEHAELPIIRVLPFLLQALSCIFFLLAGQAGFLWLAVIFYGMGNAGARIIQDVLWADYFGRLSLGTVRSTAAPLRAGVAAAGPLCMNIIFDITGSYRLAYLAFIALYSVAILFMWNCRPPQARRFARPEEVGQPPPPTE
jgi:sugar phosphate permease